MYEKQERCPYCLGTNLHPKGWNKKRSNRRCKCGDCKRHITQGGKKWFVDDHQIELVKDLSLERISLRGICRVVKISLSWLMAYIKKLYAKQPDGLNYRVPSKLEIKLQLIESELDEMWPFVY
jgi:transposase-like protein